jgi:hypothetical protein
LTPRTCGKQTNRRMRKKKRRYTERMRRIDNEKNAKKKEK